MRGLWGHSSNGRIRLHASVSKETKTIHRISFRNSPWCMLIKIYLWSSSSNEVLSAFGTSHSTTGSSVKWVTLSQNAPGIYMSTCFSFFPVIAVFDAALLWMALIAAAFQTWMA